MDETDLIQDLVEITFPEKDDFLKIRETLSRIGVHLERKRTVSIMSYSPKRQILYRSLQRVIQTRW